MPNQKALRAKALKDNIKRLIVNLQTTRAFQNSTPAQLKAGAKQLAVRWMSARRKELIEDARSSAVSADVAQFLSVSKSSSAGE